MKRLRFVDLFAGLGGFHLALRHLGHECVFASEINEELQALYRANFVEAQGITHGDIREYKKKVPPHDILCAGFPCQPFSKSGKQHGMCDKTRGTLFHEILEILDQHHPPYVILENVGNFERHDEGQTWKVVKNSLAELGYQVRGTEHVGSGGHGLVSPHHLGFPHTRERFYIVASLGQLPKDPFPEAQRARTTTLEDIVQVDSELSEEDMKEAALSEQQRSCIDHWNALLARLSVDDVALPSFPIWGDEILATYPFAKNAPYAFTAKELRKYIRQYRPPRGAKKSELLALLPSYARSRQRKFPKWKIDFIRNNRDWFERISPYISQQWIRKLLTFPPSLRKLEWNCKGENHDLWRHVLQFRPSGLRVKRFTSSPALVAMTTTQIPILGPEHRFITRIEGLRLQGFPDSHKLPKERGAAFRALGNAVHVEVVREIARRLINVG